MKRILTNKKIITVIGTIVILVITCFLTGCNKQIIDLDYSYD